MDNQLPAHITNEKDLEFFEAFISDAKKGKTNNNLIRSSNVPTTYSGKQMSAKNNGTTPNQSQSLCPDMLHSFLSNHIGKLIRIDFLIGNRIETKTGILFNVGKEYLVLKLFQNSCTMICDMNSIKFVTVVHDNDISKLNKR